MTSPDTLDFSVLARFRAGDLLAPNSSAETGQPMQVLISTIDFDATQPRRFLDEGSLAELAASIQTHGVLEPVSLRTHAETPGRFIVNRGERRVRAAVQAGLMHVPAFFDERIDPFAQAVENLHRDAMSPFDLASFIAEREKDGHTRAEIAKRLNKPRSFISEAACLIDVTRELRQAFETGRLGSDTRTLYRLARAMKSQPEKAKEILASEGAITRSTVDGLLNDGVDDPVLPSSGKDDSRSPPSTPSAAFSAGRTVLVIEHNGRRGALRFKAQDGDMAEVRFGNGVCERVSLKDLSLVCWAVEE